LAVQFAEFKIVGANARCIAMLEAFKTVIQSYNVPSGTSLSRHLPNSYLGPQITHIVQARPPLAVSLGNAVRWLKWECSQVPVEMSDDEAREMLCDRIDDFIRDRIIYADKVIQAHAIPKIRDGDVIMTFARSSVVEGILIEAKRQGKTFSVIVVDSRPMLEGKYLMLSLAQHEIPTTYVLLSALGCVINSVDLVILGAHAILSDGAMYGRAGTALVAMMAKSAGKAVVCCCETYKFSDRIMLDSIGGNEITSSASLFPSNTKDQSSSNTSLTALNLLYDVSRPEDLTAVICEAGLIPARSVPIILRDFKPLATDT